jgi:hypothetical protein
MTSCMSCFRYEPGHSSSGRMELPPWSLRGVDGQQLIPIQHVTSATDVAQVAQEHQEALEVRCRLSHIPLRPYRTRCRSPATYLTRVRSTPTRPTPRSARARTTASLSLHALCTSAWLAARRVTSTEAGIAQAMAALTPNEPVLSLAAGSALTPSLSGGAFGRPSVSASSIEMLRRQGGVASSLTPSSRAPADRTCPCLLPAGGCAFRARQAGCLRGRAIVLQGWHTGCVRGWYTGRRCLDALFLCSNPNITIHQPPPLLLLHISSPTPSPSPPFGFVTHLPALHLHLHPPLTAFLLLRMCLGTRAAPSPTKLNHTTVINAYHATPSDPVPSWDGAVGPAGPLPDNQTLAQRAKPSPNSRSQLQRSDATRTVQLL